MQNSIKFRRIKLENKDHPQGEIADDLYYECSFCSKIVQPYPDVLDICRKMTPGRFFCPFCLRHEFYSKRAQNTLVISFRAIIGHYYYLPSLWLSEIEDMIVAHEKVGLQNPVFYYDPETYLWFIDFSRVGAGKKEVALSSVYKTIINVLTCFNLYKHFQDNKTQVIFKEYRDAIAKFYNNRARPHNVLIPVPVADMTDELRGFTASKFVLNR